MERTDRPCVIFNPAAGRGLTRRLMRRVQRDRPDAFAWRPTARPGHAEELARQAALDGFATVIAAGGDGTVHEVANGLLNGGRPEVTFAVWPVGSANDYGFALNILDWWARHGWRRPPPAVRAVDVGRITGSDGRSRYFVNGLGLGINSAVTLESRRIRHLRGVALYGWAVLRAAVYHFARPEMEVAFDDAPQRGPTLALTVNLGPREGNLLLTPAARLDDGLFDYVYAGAVRRWELVRHLPGLAVGRLPIDHPHLRTGRCQRVRVRSSEPLRVHLDGEFFCHPEDGLCGLSVELLPARLRVACVPRWPPGVRRGRETSGAASYNTM